MKTEIILYIYLLIFGCCGKTCKTRDNSFLGNHLQDTSNLKESKKIDSIEIIRIMKLPLQEALKIYGKTIEGYMGKDEEFLLKYGFPEFRVELYNLYTKEQILSKTIFLKEVTWQIDNQKNLTVWYQKINDKQYMPKLHCVWNKSTVF